ncbi:FixH family protein [Roseococcus sp. DSY-14]|uniref:FixH family protein n=1 Tax=Roseococcus sp. DSY-14 TaxID=3369650 RepID=UPI00387B4ED2
MSQRKSNWIPWVFVGGMAVVIAVNAVLITSAVTTFTGTTVGRSYDRGRAYNHVLEEAARQDALGWTAQVTQPRAEALLVTVTDRAGAPIPGLLEGELLRPLDGERVPLAPVAGPGRFSVPLPEGLRAGQWELRARLVAPDQGRLDIRHRMMLP